MLLLQHILSASDWRSEVDVNSKHSDTFLPNGIIPQINLGVSNYTWTWDQPPQQFNNSRLTAFVPTFVHMVVDFYYQLFNVSTITFITWRLFASKCCQFIAMVLFFFPLFLFHMLNYACQIAAYAQVTLIFSFHHSLCLCVFVKLIQRDSGRWHYFADLH